MFVMFILSVFMVFIFFAALVVFIFALSFLILLTASAAGFISAKVSRRPLLGMKTFFLFLGGISGCFAGSAVYFMIRLFLSPEIIHGGRKDLILFLIPGSAAGAVCGIISAIVVNFFMVKTIELVGRILKK